MKRDARKNCCDGGACRNLRNLLWPRGFKVVNAQRAEAYSKFQTANTVKLVAVQFDCEVILPCAIEQLFRFTWLPGFFFYKDIDCSCQLASSHFRNQLFADLRHIV